MRESIVDLVAQLRDDPWRANNPFTPDISKWNDLLFDLSVSRAKKAAHLSSWLSNFQPCLFGRHAANRNRITFCILTEHDIAKGDEHLQHTIQACRRFWKEEALFGKSHAFVILILSERVARAEPDEILQRIALRLCQLYLSRSELNEILLDSVTLKMERVTGELIAKKWKVGVNWFGAQADGRWWHDHRIPGGIGLSMNSVGHMARQLAEEAIKANEALATRVATLEPNKLVKWALPTAMRTIHTASRGAIPGTRLAERGDTALPTGVSEEERNKILGKTLVGFNEDYYHGWYHTDITIPAEYFDPSPTRKAGASEKTLLFTYLHRDSDEDYVCMGLGEDVIKTLSLSDLEPSEDL